MAEPRQQSLEISETGEEYLTSAQWARVEALVGYYDPTRPAPALDIEFEMAENERAADEKPSFASEDVEIGTALITAAILGLIGFLVYRFGGAVSAPFSSDPDEGSQPGSEDAAILAGLNVPDVEGVAEIVAIDDRRVALVALLRAAFRRAAEDNDLRLQRSWTAREALRRIPPTWPHLPALSALARDAELAHFGGRPVPEDGFQAHLAAAAPILSGTSR